MVLTGGACGWYNLRMKTAKKVTLIIGTALLAVMVAIVGVSSLRFWVFRPIIVTGESMMPTITDHEVVYVNTTKTPKVGDVVVFYHRRMVRVYDEPSGMFDSTLGYTDVPESDAPNPALGKHNANAFWRAMPLVGNMIEDTTDYTGWDTLIKRVVGVAGDTVELRYVVEDGVSRIYLMRNNQIIHEDYIMVRDGTFNAATLDFLTKHPDAHRIFSSPAVTLQEGEIYVLGDNRAESLDSRKIGPIRVEQVLGVVSGK